ncbi:hypothetical protein KUCAC02_017525, partial [Chaenocephalus aceratus]
DKHIRVLMMYGNVKLTCGSLDVREACALKSLGPLARGNHIKVAPQAAIFVEKANYNLSLITN